MDYAFLGGELTDLIRELIEEEKLNALDVALPSVPSDPLTNNVTEIEISPVATSEQSSVVEVGEATTTPDPSIAPKALITEPSLSVTAV